MNFWFGGGNTPDTHVVGKAYPQRAVTPSKSTRREPAENPTPTNRASRVVPSSSPPPPHFHDFGNALRPETKQASPAVLTTPIQHAYQAASPSNVSHSEPPHFHDFSSYLRDAEKQRSASKVLPSPLTAPRYHTPQPFQTHHPATSPSSSHRPISDQLNPSVSRSPYRRNTHQVQLYPVDERTIVEGAALDTHHVDTDPVVPRGFGGFDNIPAAARQRQREIEDMQVSAAKQRKWMLQQQLKRDLDQQIAEKQQRKLREWEADAVAVYGSGILNAADDKIQRAKSRAANKALQSVWQIQAADSARRKGEEDAYFARHEEHWGDMKHQMERMRHDDLDSRVSDRNASWIEAWKDHQAAEGAQRKAQLQEQLRQEQLIVHPNIANYSDRILLAEQQRKAQQAAYRSALEEQVQAQAAEKQRQWAQQSYDDAVFYS